MAFVTFAAGLLLIFIVFWDALKTIVSSHRVLRRIRLTRAFVRPGWIMWRSLGRMLPEGQRRERFLSVFGPLSLLGLQAFWALLLIAGFALLQWGAAQQRAETAGLRGWWVNLYTSGQRSSRFTE